MTCSVPCGGINLFQNTFSTIFRSVTYRLTPLSLHNMGYKSHTNLFKYAIIGKGKCQCKNAGLQAQAIVLFGQIRCSLKAYRVN